MYTSPAARIITLSLYYHSNYFTNMEPVILVHIQLRCDKRFFIHGFLKVVFAFLTIDLLTEKKEIESFTHDLSEINQSGLTYLVGGMAEAAS